MKKINILLISATALTMVGCGGGGGGSTPTIANPELNPTNRSIDAYENIVNQTPVVNATNGNIVISAATTSGLGVVTSKTGLTLTQVAGGEDVALTTSDVDDSGTDTLRGFGSDVNTWRDYSKTLTSGEISVVSETISYGSEDDDYLSLGLWEYIPSDSAATVELGVWAGGGDVFDANNISGLSGTASYSGEMLGIVTDRTNTGARESTQAYLDGDVTLNANFDTNMISGSITDISAEDAYDVIESVSGSFILGNADMSSGSWTGGIVSSTGLPNGDVGAGTWGGQFYGNGASAADHPSYVAGLINGTITEDSGNTFVFSGGILAKKQ